MLLLILANGCLGVPEGVEPVTRFELKRYLGRWYEIARLDHSFERGLEGVMADYSLQPDGTVRVINQGFSPETGEWTTAEGKASFVGGEDQGHLKVSFFGPFYSSYVVFELDHEDYQYAFVSGNSRSYLWLLARDRSVSQELAERFVERAKQLGFDTEDLIFVEHDGVEHDRVEHDGDEHDRLNGTEP